MVPPLTYVPLLRLKPTERTPGLPYKNMQSECYSVHYYYFICAPHTSRTHTRISQASPRSWPLKDTAIHIANPRRILPIRFGLWIELSQGMCLCVEDKLHHTTNGVQESGTEGGRGGQKGISQMERMVRHAHLIQRHQVILRECQEQVLESLCQEVRLLPTANITHPIPHVRQAGRRRTPVEMTQGAGYTRKQSQKHHSSSVLWLLGLDIHHVSVPRKKVVKIDLSGLLNALEVWGGKNSTNSAVRKHS